MGISFDGDRNDSVTLKGRVIITEELKKEEVGFVVLAFSCLE